MAISTDCDINRALAALGKKGCEWTLSQSIPPHEIIDWRGPGCLLYTSPSPRDRG